MSDRTERFFGLVWRANAVVILAAGIGGLCLVAFALVAIVSEFLEPRRVQGIVNLAGEEIESESFDFGEFTRVRGSSYLSAPLHSVQGYPLGSRSKSSQAYRNYLFFNIVDRTAHWLLPTNDWLVESRHNLPEAHYGDSSPPPVTAIVWQIIDSDTNGDQKLTGNDLSSLYISPPAGRPLAEIATEVERLLDVQQVTPETVYVFFLRDTVLRAAEVDLTTQKVVSDGPVSPVAGPS